MRFPRPILLAAIFAAPALFGASGGAASITDIAAMAQVGAGSRISATNNAERAVSTNGVSKAQVQQELIAAWGNVDGLEGAIPLEDVSFPLVSYPDGSVRVQFKAAHALLPQDEKAYVRGKGIHMEMFEPGGLMSGLFRSDNCIFDRATRTGYCEGRVRVQYQNVKITGTNMVWDLETRNVKVLSGARVIVNRFMSNLGSVFKK